MSKFSYTAGLNTQLFVGTIKRKRNLPKDRKRLPFFLTALKRASSGGTELVSSVREDEAVS